jgi:hypothetical protein
MRSWGKSSLIVTSGRRGGGRGGRMGGVISRRPEQGEVGIKLYDYVCMKSIDGAVLLHGKGHHSVRIRIRYWHWAAFEDMTTHPLEMSFDN